MARITCSTPSTGKPIRVTLESVNTTFTTVAEAPDFSVPDPSQRFSIRDPLNDDRAIRAGEVFFVTPLAAKNKSASTAWIEVRMLTENGSVIEFGRVSVPANDTVFVPIQGRSLFKNNSLSINGDRLQLRAQTLNSFDIWAAAEEKLLADHIGVQ